MEVVLGGSLQYIVTLNEQVTAAISWLKTNNRDGLPFTFGPVKVEKPRQHSSGPGVIGCLADLITYQLNIMKLLVIY